MTYEPFETDCSGAVDTTEIHKDCMFDDQELRGNDLQRARYQVKKAKPLRDLTIYEISHVMKFICCCCYRREKKDPNKDQHADDHVGKSFVEMIE